ncbi:MAG: hypothetical protein ACI4MK_10785 [Aristaeellaceae bacterium]
MTTILRIAAAALMGAAVLAAAVCMMQYGQDGTAAMLLSRLPRSGWAAALCLWCLYALKSVVMVFPVTLLFAVGGMVFPLPRALLVNGVGLCIAVTLPYRLGRKRGMGLMARLKRQYPGLAGMGQPGFFRVLTVRALGLLPLDAVSLYMGASGAAYLPYLGGSVAGMLFRLATATALGVHMDQPLSPAFLTALALHGLMLGLSAWISRRRRS